MELTCLYIWRVGEALKADGERGAVNPPPITWGPSMLHVTRSRIWQERDGSFLYRWYRNKIPPCCAEMEYCPTGFTNLADERRYKYYARVRVNNSWAWFFSNNKRHLIRHVRLVIELAS